MRFAVLLVLFPFLLLSQVTPPNGNFEQGTVGEVPQAWYVGAQNVDFTAVQGVTTDQGCAQGSKCGMLTMPANAPANSYAVLGTNVAPGSYPASSIRIRAAVKVSAGAQAGVWVNVQRIDNSLVSSGVSSPITSTGWAYYSDDVLVSLDSTIISFGLVLYTPGTAWIDDVTIQVLAPPVPPRTETPEGPRALSDTGLANLVAFAKVAGYARYFHPSDQAEQLDWNTWVINGVRAVESAASPSDLAAKMKTLLDPIAPTIQIFQEGSSPDLPPELHPSPLDGLSVRQWLHIGVGAGMDLTNAAYQSSRLSAAVSNGQLPATFSNGLPVTNPTQTYTASLGNGLSVRVPVALFADAQGTLPHRASAAPTEFWQRDITDRGTRLADVMLTWNILQHFYPYFDVETVDMPGELRRALTSAATNTGAEDFRDTLRKFLAALKDGQAGVTYVNRTTYSVPLVWAWVEGQVIITRIRAYQGQNVHLGDKVLTIDGKNVSDRMAELTGNIAGATPQWIRWQLLQEMSYCGSSHSMALEVEPYSAPGTRQTLQFTCFQNYTDWSEPRPTANAQLESGMMYIDLSRIGQTELTRVMPQVQAANTIVFDLRGVPPIWPPTILSYFATSTWTGDQWLYPIATLPDRTATFPAEFDWAVQPATPRLGARCVFIADERTVSHGEDYLNFIESHKLGEIIGATTAGTTGEVLPFTLPGGFHVQFTGMKVLKADGRRFHGLGVRPNVPASRTRRTIAEATTDLDRDELLVKARQVVKGPQSGAKPAITAAGIVNAASFQGGAVAPGEFVSLFGTNLGGAGLLGLFDESNLLANYVGETRVLFDGIQAPLQYASSLQVNAIVPYGVGSANTVVTVEWQGRSSDPVTVPVAAAAPGIFAYVGGVRAVIQNEDLSLNSASNPAERGHQVVLYATGEGVTTPLSPDGLWQPGIYPVPVGDLEVLFDGKPGEIIFKGDNFPGEIQVNVRVPTDASTGPAVPVKLVVAGAQSKEVTVALR